MTVINLHAARTSYRARAHEPREATKHDHSVPPSSTVVLHDGQKALLDVRPFRLGQPCGAGTSAWLNTWANLLMLGAELALHQSQLLLNAALHLNASLFTRETMREETESCRTELWANTFDPKRPESFAPNWTRK